MSRTSEYYKKNTKARKKRLEYQKRYNKQKKQIRKRSLLNKENRRRGTYGNGDKMDVSHRKDGSTFLEAQSKNRARNRSRA